MPKHPKLLVRITSNQIETYWSGPGPSENLRALDSGRQDHGMAQCGRSNDYKWGQDCNATFKRDPRGPLALLRGQNPLLQYGARNLLLGEVELYQSIFAMGDSIFTLLSAEKVVCPNWDILVRNCPSLLFFILEKHTTVISGSNCKIFGIFHTPQRSLVANTYTLS